MRAKVGDFLATAFGATSGDKRQGPSAPAPARPVRVEGVASRRNELRDLLYGIVRETMVASEVLSSAYRFKVLTLDPEGLRHSIMIDIAPEFGMNPALLLQLEQRVQRRAFELADMSVDSVYWRCSVPAIHATSRPSRRPTQQPVFGAYADMLDPRMGILSADQGSLITNGFEDTRPISNEDAVAPGAVLGGTQRGV